jgi:hypothetical protein
MYVRNIEPSVAELLDDEVGRLVMARDGLDAEAVRAFIRAVALRLEPCREAPGTSLTGRAA